MAQLGKLQMHLGCPSGSGILMQTSLELFILELGLSFQPFTVDYTEYGRLVTHCWFKTVWEKVHRFGFHLTFHNIHLSFPKTNDEFLLQRLIDLG